MNPVLYGFPLTLKTLLGLETHTPPGSSAKTTYQQPFNDPLHPDELMQSSCFLLPYLIPNERLPLSRAMLLTKLPSCPRTFRVPSPVLRWNHAIAMDVSPLPKRDDDDNGGDLFDAKHSPFTEKGRLPAGLLSDWMPRHVAVIMDGNARWASRHGLPPSAGHEAGLRSLRELVRRCSDWGIKVLTVFAFSSDNWYRPKAEVDFLMGLFERVIRKELDSFVRDGVKICVIGDSSKLSSSLQKAIAYAEETTKRNSQIQLIIAVSYSGKYDIVQSCKSIARKVKDGILQVEDINENLIERELETSCSEYPYPDLLIRTSGELRVSNFLLWQLAYAELFFAPAFWPDFGEAELIEALVSYQQRQRRYGIRSL